MEFHFQIKKKSSKADDLEVMMTVLSQEKVLSVMMMVSDSFLHYLSKYFLQQETRCFNIRRLVACIFSIYSESPKVENDEQGEKRYSLQPKSHVFTSIPSAPS